MALEIARMGRLIDAIRIKVNAQVAIFSNTFPFKNINENKKVSKKKPQKATNSDGIYLPEA